MTYRAGREIGQVLRMRAEGEKRKEKKKEEADEGGHGWEAGVHHCVKEGYSFFFPLRLEVGLAKEMYILQRVCQERRLKRSRVE